MISNLLSSLNITLPIFIMILLGWLLRRREMVNENFVVRANDLIFTVALPVKLFADVAACDLRSSMDIRFVLLALGVSVLCMLIAWFTGSALLKDPRQQSAFIHGSFRGNFAYVGLALLENVAGQGATAAAAVVMATVLPLYNIAGVVVLSLKDPNAGRLNVWKLLWNALKTPMVIGILAAIPFSLLEVKFPFIIQKPLNYLSVMVAPLALLNVGASVSFSSLRREIKKLLPACFLKLILQPLIMVPAGILLGLTTDEVLVLLVLAGTPSAVNSYIVTQRMGGDGEMASGIVVLTTGLSIFTLTLWLFVLKALGVW